ncbi:MAG TPA: ribosomal protein S18-alanine N-acetyltransferase [Actinomycetes bacterium]|nr:ribosomal protein S18-alanine N-acetyltransferase [Actinomycetes bacterium]
MTNTDLTVVRPMRWWDIAGVHDVEARAFPDTAWSVESFWSELAGVPDTRHYLVAESGEQIIGYAGLMAIGRDADVQTLAVAPDSRGAGLGARLLDELLNEARRRGCSRVTLDVASTGKDAQGLYRARGFDVIGRRSSYYGSGVDALIMRRRLTPTAPVVESQGTLS